MVVNETVDVSEVVAALEDLLLSDAFDDLAAAVGVPSLLLAVVDFAALDDFNFRSSPLTVGTMDDAATTVIN